jgi:putative alpha-1,2-mannosidase
VKITIWAVRRPFTAQIEKKRYTFSTRHTGSSPVTRARQPSTIFFLIFFFFKKNQNKTAFHKYAGGAPLSLRHSISQNKTQNQCASCSKKKKRKKKKEKENKKKKKKKKKKTPANHPITIQDSLHFHLR